MCLRCADDDRTQVYPEASRNHPSEVSAKQSIDRRIRYMRNLRKEKKKLSKQFSRPSPVPGEVLRLSPGDNAINRKFGL
ncbi:coiled-coil domain-containing protein 179 [Castor canadensis]|uniref:Coiled-coil domain-containing protein 179 n=1 Tax=Castor canadensis TaxID=51338 RepID=A0A8B7WJT1_CASCN